jgi:hypothetical protein
MPCGVYSASAQIGLKGRNVRLPSARFVARAGDHIAEFRDLDRQLVHHDPKRSHRVIDRARDGGRRAEVAGFAFRRRYAVTGSRDG